VRPPANDSGVGSKAGSQKQCEEPASRPPRRGGDRVPRPDLCRGFLIAYLSVPHNTNDSREGMGADPARARPRRAGGLRDWGDLDYEDYAHGAVNGPKREAEVYEPQRPGCFRCPGDGPRPLPPYSLHVLHGHLIRSHPSLAPARSTPRHDRKPAWRRRSQASIAELGRRPVPSLAGEQGGGSCERLSNRAASPPPPGVPALSVRPFRPQGRGNSSRSPIRCLSAARARLIRVTRFLPRKPRWFFLSDLRGIVR
jgi:hypothetical protein